MKQINTLIKPTHQCNIRCKYCFHEKYGYSNDLLEMKKLKRYIELLSDEYQYINIVWHGGEPLLVPLPYYEEIYEFCRKQNSIFSYSIQTNGTLLNSDIIAFFKENNTNIGLSFDGLKNEFTRSNTEMILENINMLHKNKLYPGAIMVVNQNNVNNLIEEYNYFKTLNLSMKINPMFNDGAAKNNKEFQLDPNDYINSFVNLFKYWTVDRTCNINVSNFEEIVNLVINENSGVCTFNSCLGKWLCLDTNGNIYPCDRLCTEEYNLGNTNDLESINDVFKNEKFIVLLKSTIERRQKCIEQCEYYNNCYGGCNANVILNNKNNESVSCVIQKKILSEIKDYILNTTINENQMNYNYIQCLRKRF